MMAIKREGNNRKQCVMKQIEDMCIPHSGTGVPDYHMTSVVTLPFLLCDVKHAM